MLEEELRLLEMRVSEDRARGEDWARGKARARQGQGCDRAREGHLCVWRV